MASAQLEIHFFDQDDEAAVELRGERLDEFGEVLLFSLYTARQLIDLGRTDQKIGLGMRLRHWDHPMLDFLLETDPLPRLTPYKGSPARQRFAAAIEYGEDLSVPDEAVSFACEHHGFGRFNRRFPYYAAASVEALLYFLGERRKADPEYIDRLASAAQWLGHMAQWEYLSPQSLVRRSVFAAQESWPPRDEETPLGDLPH